MFLVRIYSENVKSYHAMLLAWFSSIHSFSANRLPTPLYGTEKRNESNCSFIENG